MHNQQPAQDSHCSHRRRHIAGTQHDRAQILQPSRMTLNYALGQRCAHVIKLTRVSGIFKARQGRLRSHIEPRNRIPVEQHLVHGIGCQSGRVVGTGISTADGEHALGEKIAQRMVNFCQTAEDRVSSQTCWRSIRSDARLLSAARRHHRRSPAAGRIPTSPAWRKSLGTTNALSR
jgi:hypothetical protein